MIVDRVTQHDRCVYYAVYGDGVLDVVLVIVDGVWLYVDDVKEFCAAR